MMDSLIGKDEGGMPAKAANVRYQGARNEAIRALIAAHPEEWGELFAASKTKAGIVSRADRSIASKKAKAVKLLAELESAGVTLD